MFGLDLGDDQVQSIRQTAPPSQLTVLASHPAWVERPLWSRPAASLAAWMSHPSLPPLAESRSLAELTHSALRVPEPLLALRAAQEHQLLLVSPAPAHRRCHQSHSQPK